MATSLVRQLLELSAAHSKADRAAQNVAALGSYHVGGGGVAVDGVAYGGCPRKALLRSLGVDSTLDAASELMTSGGRANELFWQQRLEVPGSPYLVLNEGDLHVSWQTGAGSKVSGHPDGFIAVEDLASPVIVQAGRHQGKHVRVLKFIELKRVSTAYKAKDYIFSGVPGDDHLMQCAHYSWLLGELQGSPVPVELAYTQDVKFFCPDWPFMQSAARLRPELCKMNAKRKAQDLLPNITVYLAKWEETPQGARFCWTTEREPDKMTKTAITVAAIKAFYDQLDVMAVSKQLSARPADIQLSTGTKRGWSSCDPKYCEFADTCNSLEHDFEAWLAEARRSKVKVGD